MDFHGNFHVSFSIDVHVSFSNVRTLWYFVMHSFSFSSFIIVTYLPSIHDSNMYDTIWSRTVGLEVTHVSCAQGLLFQQLHDSQLLPGTLLPTLRGDESECYNSYIHVRTQTPEKSNQPSAITRPAAHFTCSLKSDLVTCKHGKRVWLYITLNVLIGTRCH